MVDIQSAAAEISEEKKKKERTKPQRVPLCLQYRGLRGSSELTLLVQGQVKFQLLWICCGLIAGVDS